MNYTIAPIRKNLARLLKESSSDDLYIKNILDIGYINDNDINYILYLHNNRNRSIDEEKQIESIRLCGLHHLAHCHKNNIVFNRWCFEAYGHIHKFFMTKEKLEQRSQMMCV